MFKYKNKKFFFVYLLINIFFYNTILTYNSSLEKKQINELQKYLDEKTNKKSNNKLLKEVTSKNIEHLSNQILKTISEKKKLIIRILSNLENLFLEIKNLNTKKSSLKKINKKINTIKKQINEYTKNKTNTNKQIYIDKLNFLIESIESSLIKRNKQKKSFIKKIVNSTILILIASASIAGTTFYSNSKKPKKEFYDFFKSVIKTIKAKITSPNTESSGTESSGTESSGTESSGTESSDIEFLDPITPTTTKDIETPNITINPDQSVSFSDSEISDQEIIDNPMNHTRASVNTNLTIETDGILNQEASSNITAQNKIPWWKNLFTGKFQTLNLEKELRKKAWIEIQINNFLGLE